MVKHRQSSHENINLNYYRDDSWRNDSCFSSRRGDEQESNIPHFYSNNYGESNWSGNRPPDRSYEYLQESNTPHFYAASCDPAGGYGWDEEYDQLESYNNDRNQQESNTPHFYSAGNYEPRGDCDRHYQLENQPPNLRFHRNNDRDFSRNDNRDQKESMTPHFYSAGNYNEPRGYNDRNNQLENNDREFSRKDNIDQKESKIPHFYSAGNCYEPRGDYDSHEYDLWENYHSNESFHPDFISRISYESQHGSSNSQHYFEGSSYKSERGYSMDNQRGFNPNRNLNKNYSESGRNFGKDKSKSRGSKRDYTSRISEDKTKQQNQENIK